MDASISSLSSKMDDTVTTEQQPPGTSSRDKLATHRPMTELVCVDNPNLKDPYRASSVPIYQSATFKQTSARGMASAEFDYARSGNPTRSHLEHHLAKIIGGTRAFAVSSGMGALDVITRLLRPGDEIVTGDDLYGGTNRLLGHLQSNGGIVVHHVDTTQLEPVLARLNRKTRLVLLETPTNPLIKIADIRAISKAAHDYDAEIIVAVDNTMMSCYLQRPLDLGADVVYDSATKYLSGHHDLMAGAIAVKDDALAKSIYFIINATGCGLAPFDSWLLLRGVKTLGVRMEQQQKNAMIVAQYLYAKGFNVHYPGLPSHPQYRLHQDMASGPGAVLSFETGSVALSERIVETTRIWGISVSFGCVNSLISMPCLMSHASIDPATRAARNLPEDLIRLCVGIEDPRDLVEDLEQALIQSGTLTFDGSEIDRRLVDYEARSSDADRGGPIQVSAPGKVILFGEHAAVHGVPAIAASINLRTHLEVEPRDDGQVVLDFPDIGLRHAWEIDTLPWEVALSGDIAAPPTDLDQALVDELEPALSVFSDKTQRAASFAFLYLYMSISDSERRPKRGSGHLFRMHSDLPISAGLGSSASISICLAAGILKAFGYMTSPESVLKWQGEQEMINAWGFLGDKVIHGNPSGIDTTVACFGSAYVFERGRGMEALRMPRLDILLVNTRVKRETSLLVAKVGQLVLAQPDETEKTFSAIRAITLEAKKLLADSSLPSMTLIERLSRLVVSNQALLTTLGVGHPSIDKIIKTVSSRGYAAKLTGAGGGGCVVVLLGGDGEVDREMLESLERDGFDCFKVEVGVEGVRWGGER